MVSTSSETQGGNIGLPASVSGRHVVRGSQSPPILECAEVTGKSGENGQYSGEMGGSSPWTRPSAPGCGDTLKALASYGSIQGGDRPRRRLQGRYRLGLRPVVFLCYQSGEVAQCTVRPSLGQGKQLLRPPRSSVAVHDRGH